MNPSLILLFHLCSAGITGAHHYAPFYAVLETEPQGFVHARQALYPLTHPLSSRCATFGDVDKTNQGWLSPVILELRGLQ